MPRIRLMKDTLDEENRRFEQVRLPQPLFLNSVPKSGSHLLRNIMRMFVPVEDQYSKQFIQWPNFNDHLAAFDAERCMLSWGHLLFADASAIETARVRKIILVRDPYSWVLARARFFVSDQYGDNAMLVKSSELSIDALINLMIFGVQPKGPTLRDLYAYNAVAWLTTDARLVRYEDLTAALKDLDGAAGETFFMQMFEDAGFAAVPDDWRERVRIGSDRKQSGTARENLSSAGIAFPPELSTHQKALVDYAAPGLRKLLGYE